MSNLNKRMRNANLLISACGPMFLISCAALGGANKANNGTQLPDYDDSIAKYDVMTRPRVDFLHNKILAAESNDEIDYADFRELIEITARRDDLCRKKAHVDSIKKRLADTTMVKEK